MKIYSSPVLAKHKTDFDLAKYISEDDNSSNSISKFKSKQRMLVDWSTLNDWSSWNIETYWIWNTGVWTSNPSYKKSISTYQSWSTSDSMVKYCYNYVNTDTSSISSFGTTVHHQAYNGVITKGSYCQWQYTLDYNSVNRFNLTRNNLNNEIIEIFFQGTQGETLTFNDNKLQKTSNNFDVYNAISVRISAVTTVELTENDYRYKTLTLCLSILCNLNSIFWMFFWFAKFILYIREVL